MPIYSHEENAIIIYDTLLTAIARLDMCDDEARSILVTRLLQAGMSKTLTDFLIDAVNEIALNGTTP